MGRLSVAMVNDWVSNERPGGTYRVQGFALGLSRLGNEVYLVTPWGVTEFRGDAKLDQVDVGSPLYYFTTTVPLLASMLRALGKARGLDLVVVQMPSPVTKPLTLLPLLRRLGIPVVLDFGDPWWSGHEPEVYKDLAAVLLRYELWKSVAVTSSSKLLLKALTLIRPDLKTLHIPNGFDERLFRPQGKPEEGLVGFLGRFSKRNGSRLIIPILRPLVSRYGDNARFLLVGSGEDLPMIMREARDAGLFDLLEITGAVSREQVPRILSRACVLVAPYEISRALHFIFPTKVPEMMALMRPVITAPLYEVLTTFKVGKELIVADEPKHYATQLHTIINDPDMSTDIALAAYSKVTKELSWTRLSASLIRVVLTG